MKIAFAHMFTLRTPRGIERYIINVSNALARRGHDLTIITGRCPQSPTRGWIDSRVRVHEIGHHNWHKLTFVPGFVRDFVTNEYDVVNLAIARGEGYAAGLAYKLKKFRYNIVFHAPLEHHEKHFDAFKRFSTARHAEELIAVSRYIARGVEACFGRPVKTVPNGVDQKLFRPDEERRREMRRTLAIPENVPVLLTVSALQGRKGINKTLDVVALLKKDMPDIRYIICGDGNEKDRSAFFSRIASLGLGSSVLFMGNQNDVSGFYNAADLFVFLPEFEGFGIVVIEAMASCLPVVVSQGSAFPEILADGGGMMVDPDAPGKTAGTIQLLLRDRNRMTRLGSEGRASVEKHYSWDAVALQLEAIFENQIGKHRS
jgi:glycosyltransferase involved in cell wall biosynthesis